MTCELCQTGPVSNGNRTQTVNGIHLVWLKGTSDERARDHTRLIREHVKAGPLMALAKKNEWAIRRGPAPLLYSKTLQNQVVKLYRHVLMDVLERGLTPAEKRQVDLVSEESGLDRARVREALFQPDAFMILSRLSITKHLLKELPGGGLSGSGIGIFGGGLPGCTSVALSPAWTESGRLLLARNLDYPIVGPWEGETTVLMSESSTHGKAKADIPHVAVTSAGVHTTGLTAVNREGLTLSIHAHFGKKISLKGRPIFSIGEDVITQATTIAEAVDLVKKTRRIGNWAFVIGSAREKSAAVIEMTPDQVRVREMDHSGSDGGYLSHTNFFQTQDVHEQEACLSPACNDDLEARLCGIRDATEPYRGKITPQHLAKALGNLVDPFSKEERVVGNTVGVVTTVQSVVMDPEDQRIWVSSKKTSPTGHGPYLELALDDLWKTRSFDESQKKTLEGYVPREPRILKAQEAYRRAFIAFGMENDREDYLERTLKCVEEAVSFYPEDAHLWVQNGLVAFRLCYFLEASRCFEEALKRKMTANMKGVCHLFLGRSEDLIGDRTKALEHYRFESQIQEPRLKKALKDGLKRKFKESRIAYIILDMQFPDSFQYG